MRDERFRELCLEHLLGGLGPEEREELERELEAGGERRRRELDRLREVVASLALAATPVDPPPELGDRILAGVREAARGRGGPEPADPGGARPLRTGREESGASPDGFQGWMAAAALFFLAAVGLGAWNLQLRQELGERRAALEEARSRIASLDSVNRSLAGLEGDLRTLASPDTRLIGLSGTEARPGAHARVFVDPTTGRALVFAYELPILPPDSVYQLWAIRGQRPASAGTFTSSETGPARLRLEDASVLEGADAFAVTVEPAPGRPAPTGEMVLFTAASS